MSGIVVVLPDKEGTVILRDALSDVLSWFDCGMFPTGSLF